jgi:hypothetical protein
VHKKWNTMEHRNLESAEEREPMARTMPITVLESRVSFVAQPPIDEATKNEQSGPNSKRVGVCLVWNDA